MTQSLENGRGVPIGDLLARDTRNDLINLRDQLRADEREKTEELKAHLAEIFDLLHLPDSERPLMRGRSLRIASQKMR